LVAVSVTGGVISPVDVSYLGLSVLAGQVVPFQGR